MESLKTAKGTAYSGIPVTREGDEWKGRFEARVLKIKHMKGSVELSEVISISKDTDVVKNSITKRMHFSSSDKLVWGEINFSIGGWSYPVRFTAEFENRRILKTFPDIDKSGVDVEKMLRGYVGAERVILEGEGAGVYRGYCVKGDSILYEKTTVINITGTPLVVNVQKTYDMGGGHAFRSISANLLYEKITDNL